MKLSATIYLSLKYTSRIRYIQIQLPSYYSLALKEKATHAGIRVFHSNLAGNEHSYLRLSL